MSPWAKPRETCRTRSVFANPNGSARFLSRVIDAEQFLALSMGRRYYVQDTILVALQDSPSRKSKLLYCSVRALRSKTRTFNEYPWKISKQIFCARQSKPALTADFSGKRKKLRHMEVIRDELYQSTPSYVIFAAFARENCVPEPFSFPVPTYTLAVVQLSLSQSKAHLFRRRAPKLHLGFFFAHFGGQRGGENSKSNEKTRGRLLCRGSRFGSVVQITEEISPRWWCT